MQIFDAAGIQIEDGRLYSYVKPRKTITEIIQSLTGITNKKVKDAPTFDKVGSSFVQFIYNKILDYKPQSSNSNSTQQQGEENICFVTHNGQKFDVPFLIEQMVMFQVKSWIPFLMKGNVCQLDTLLLTKGVL